MEYVPNGGGIHIHEDEMPGCCAVAVAHTARPQARGRLHPEGMKEAVAQLVSGRGTDLKPNLWLYTLTADQVTEKEALLASGFEPLKTFTSSTSGNEITLYGRVIEVANRPRRRRARR
jgi:hypothetical protein